MKRHSILASIALVTLCAVSCTATTTEEPEISLGVTLHFLEGVSVRVRLDGALLEESANAEDLQHSIESQLREGGLAVVPLDEIEDPLVGSVAMLQLRISTDGCTDSTGEAVVRSSMTLHEIVSPLRDPDTVFILPTWSLDRERPFVPGEGNVDVSGDARELAGAFLEEYLQANPDATVGPDPEAGADPQGG